MVPAACRPGKRKNNPHIVNNRNDQLPYSAILRHRARQCEVLALEATDEQVRRRFQRLAEGWQVVSQTQSWLDGEIALDDGASTRSSDAPHDTSKSILKWHIGGLRVSLRS
jgi:hypothetical protein